MGKIKGWKKEGVGKILYWVKRIGDFSQHDEAIEIKPNLYTVGLLWDVSIYKLGGIGGREYIVEKTFKTKIRAIEYAKEWMRKHPK